MDSRWEFSSREDVMSRTASLTIVLLAGCHDAGTPFHTFTFNAENDVAAFVGIWSEIPIKLLEIRELTDDNGDEFFGDFYAGQTAPPPIPEPSTLVTLGGLLGTMGLIG
jgi:hypothetical protein